MRRTQTTTALFAASFLILLHPAAAQTPGIQKLLEQMSLEEKISLLGGARDPIDLGEAGYWPGLPRLGIPPLRLADGPPGINVTKAATGMPAPVGLAATFSREAARSYGVVLGREARAREQDVLLAPHVNIVRDPLFRRNHTTLSEDPLLSAQLGVAEIAGIQNQGVMAQVKHLSAYNGTDDVVVDERTLHEIYLPAFEAAVRAGVASVMCSYSKVNGTWACENADLLNGILRGQWGFNGFVTSDWGAVHSPDALISGMDLEMPGREIAYRGGPVFRDGLLPLVESGQLPVGVIDRAVGRILGQMERFGLLEGTDESEVPSIDVVADAAIVRKIAADGAVLLKNEGDILPLEADDLASLAVIGPTGRQVAVGYLGERGAGFDDRLVGPLVALRQSTPEANIAYAVGTDLAGVPIPLSALSNQGTPGLLRKQTFPPTDATVVDRSMDFNGPTALAPNTEFSWMGTLTVATEGDYTFMVQPGGDGAEGGGTVAINGSRIVQSGTPGGGSLVAKKWSSLLPTPDGRDNARTTVHLAAGAHKIELTASSTGDAPLSIRFAWMTPELRRRQIDAAVALAKTVRTPVVFAWNGVGHSFALPEDQNGLIERVAAVNPRTIVVLNTGSPVAMPWRDRVRGIVEMWYPGQEGGWATADILLGRVNPAGRLPVTFPVRLEDGPARASGHPERLGVPALSGGAGVLFTETLGRLMGSLGVPEQFVQGGRQGVFTATYSEGIAVGYRWYDQQKIDPLFCFGYGLSYTSFEYSDLTVRRDGDGFNVSFTLRNSGSRSGAEVPQIYLGPVHDPPVPMAPRSLVGFERVELEPDQSERLTIHLGERQLSYWSTAEHGWVLPNGGRRVTIGASSRDIRLEGGIP